MKKEVTVHEILKALGNNTCPVAIDLDDTCEDGHGDCVECWKKALGFDKEVLSPKVRPKLTKDAYRELVKLSDKFTHIAKDKDSGVYAYGDENCATDIRINKDSTEWYTFNNHHLNNDYEMLSWEDEKPTLISELIAEMPNINYDLTENERVLLGELPRNLTYIAKDDTGCVYAYNHKVVKDGCCWRYESIDGELKSVKSEFKMLSFEDESPVLIDDLLANH